MLHTDVQCIIMKCAVRKRTGNCVSLPYRSGDKIRNLEFSGNVRNNFDKVSRVQISSSPSSFSSSSSSRAHSIVSSILIWCFTWGMGDVRKYFSMKANLKTLSILCKTFNLRVHRKRSCANIKHFGCAIGKARKLRLTATMKISIETEALSRNQTLRQSLLLSRNFLFLLSFTFMRKVSFWLQREFI